MRGPLYTQLLSSVSDTWSLSHNNRPRQLKNDEVLVQTSHVGLNPFDWKGIKHRFSLKQTPAVLGRDGTGIVSSIGDSVHRLKVGDRVWFCANSAVANSGAFQGYSVHKASEVGLLPPNVSLPSGATLGTGLLTAAIVLFKCFRLPVDRVRSEKKPSDKGPWIFIVSGSSSTGQYLIQLSRLLGLQVICTGSVSNHQVLKRLGAHVVLDRHLSIERQIEEILSATGADGVSYAVDNVGAATVEHCRRILNTDAGLPEGYLVALAGDNKDSYHGTRKISTIPISFSTTFFGRTDFSTVLMDTVHDLLLSGSLECSPHEIAPGGLNGIKEALLLLETGQVRPMNKLIVRVKEGRKEEKRENDNYLTLGVKRKAALEGQEERSSKAIRA